MTPTESEGEDPAADSGSLLSAERGYSSTLWLKFLAFESVLALIYFPFGIPSGTPRILGFLPWMEWAGQVPAWALLGLSSAAAFAYGIKHYRPKAPVAWWFLGAGVLLFITGDTTYKFWHQIMGQNNIPFPSFIDGIYVTMYPVVAVGLLLLARARVPGGDRESARLPNGHPRRRPALLDLPHRAQCPRSWRNARTTDSSRLPAW